MPHAHAILKMEVSAHIDDEGLVIVGIAHQSLHFGPILVHFAQQGLRINSPPAHPLFVSQLKLINRRQSEIVNFGLDLIGKVIQVVSLHWHCHPLNVRVPNQFYFQNIITFLCLPRFGLFKLCCFKLCCFKLCCFKLFCFKLCCFKLFCEGHLVCDLSCASIM